MALPGCPAADAPVADGNNNRGTPVDAHKVTAFRFRGIDDRLVGVLMLDMDRLAFDAYRLRCVGDGAKGLLGVPRAARQTATHPTRTGPRLHGMARREKQIELNRRLLRRGSCAGVHGTTAELTWQGDRGSEYLFLVLPRR
jgi:hypothetical protein